MMKQFLTSLAVVGAVVALATTAVLTQHDVSEAQPVPQQGIVHMSQQAVNLSNDTWTGIPLVVTLPSAGTYELDADVRARLHGQPSVNSYITARLWNETTGFAVPQSERLVYQIIDHNVDDASTGGNQTASISELIHVNGPTTIRLQAHRFDTYGSASVAQIYSNYTGYTSLRFNRVDD